MAQHALGEIKPSSTTVALPATNNVITLGLSDSISKHYPCQALQFQALSTNTGTVRIVDRQNPTLTLNTLVEIPVPTPSSVLPTWTIGDPSKVAAFDAATFWILPSVNGEGVRVTVVVG